MNGEARHSALPPPCRRHAPLNSQQLTRAIFCWIDRTAAINVIQLPQGR